MKTSNISFTISTILLILAAIGGALYSISHFVPNSLSDYILILWCISHLVIAVGILKNNKRIIYVGILLAALYPAWLFFSSVTDEFYRVKFYYNFYIWASRIISLVFLFFAVKISNRKSIIYGVISGIVVFLVSVVISTADKSNRIIEWFYINPISDVISGKYSLSAPLSKSNIFTICSSIIVPLAYLLIGVGYSKDRIENNNSNTIIIGENSSEQPTQDNTLVDNSINEVQSIYGRNNTHKDNKPNEKDIVQYLKDYKKLLDSGILIPEEFDLKKKQLLEDLSFTADCFSDAEIITHLKDYKGLLDSDILTHEEFDKIKKQLLQGMVENTTIPKGKHGVEELRSIDEGKKIGNDKKASEEKVQIERFHRLGASVSFGNYYLQDGKNKSKMEWIVLDENKNRSLLISKYAIDAHAFNSTLIETNWEKSDLRKWLNEHFIKIAFSPEEQRAICITKIPNEQHNNLFCEDKVFLISKDELNKYLVYPWERKCQITDYAQSQGSFCNSKGIGWWWLRSSGKQENNALCVNSDGKIRSIDVNNSDSSVRPLLWLDTDLI